MASSRFWNSAELQPKRKFRWIIELGLSDSTTLQYAAKTVNKPNYTLTGTKHKFLNHTFNFPNRVEWQPITLTMVDHVGPEGLGSSVTDILFGKLVGSGYHNPSSVENCSFSVTKKASSAVLGEVTIKQLGGGDGDLAPLTLETWSLKNPWISKVTWGDLSYEDDGLVEITVELTYDFADLNGALGK